MKFSYLVFTTLIISLMLLVFSYAVYSQRLAFRTVKASSEEQRILIRTDQSIRAIVSSSEGSYLSSRSRRAEELRTKIFDFKFDPSVKIKKVSFVENENYIEVETSYSVGDGDYICNERLY